MNNGLIIFANVACALGRYGVLLVVGHFLKWKQL